ncbi:MAG TPA: T9SS type A sorting domain-containing protein [Saprospiraceae bacterium]|nr:T9SS type A sorting domain-containing protein [Saprospiraceae bacterium]HMQ85092.1 T9SS type A sorting domain-containing protein [Saprospiraceae bacterium]
MKRKNCLLVLSLFFNGLNPALSQVFWTETFNNGIPTDWTNEDVSTVGTPVLWEYCDESTCPPNGLSIPLPPFQSSSSGDGYVFVNSEAGGALAQGHTSVLSSAPIDCSSQNEVFIQFQTLIATSHKNAAQHVRLIVQAGGMESIFYPFPALKENNQLRIAPQTAITGNNDPFFVTFDISEIAAYQSDVVLRWEWEGDQEYIWCLDDIILSTQQPAAPDHTLWFESFGEGLGDWQSIPLSAPSGQWDWVPGGNVSNGYGITVSPADYAFIHSKSSSDGAAVFNADFYNTNGETPSPQTVFYTYSTELLSPIIDLSSVSNPIAIQFDQLVWLGPDGPIFDPNDPNFITSLAYSTNGGVAWSDWIDVNPFLSPVTAPTVETFFPLSNSIYISIPDNVNSSQFRIKFKWESNLYFWVLDDVAIIERSGVDMKVNRNFYATLPNAITPISQLEDTHFLADLSNIGALNAEGVELQISVKKTGESIPLFEDALPIGAVAVDELVENSLLENPLESEMITTTGTYVGRYTVKSDVGDSRPSDNSLDWEFQISDSLFSKEFGFTRDIAPATSAHAYSIGNCYHLPNGVDWYAKYVSFGIGNAHQIAGFIDNTVGIFLYKWEGDFNNDHIANDGEYFLVPNAFNEYRFNGTEGFDLITVPISFEEVGVPLDDNGVYLVVLRFETLPGSGNRYLTLVSDTLDYEATWYLSDSLLQAPRYTGVLDVGNTGDFSTIGYGLNIAHQIRLHIGQSPVLTQAITPQASPGIIKVWPSPGATEMHVKIAMETPLLNPLLKISDMSGSVLMLQKLSPLQEKELTFDARFWPSGTYIVQISEGQHFWSSKFIIAQ